MDSPRVVVVGSGVDHRAIREVLANVGHHAPILIDNVDTASACFGAPDGIYVMEEGVRYDPGIFLRAGERHEVYVAPPRVEDQRYRPDPGPSRADRQRWREEARAFDRANPTPADISAIRLASIRRSAKGAKRAAHAKRSA